MTTTKYRYSHAYSLCFGVETFDHTGEHPLPSQLRAAILQRLASLTDTELIATVGPPHDSYRLPSVIAVAPSRRSDA